MRAATHDFDRRRRRLAGSRLCLNSIQISARTTSAARRPTDSSSVLALVADTVATGVFRGADVGLFTNAYFHRPQELADEVQDAGFAEPHLYNIEGPGFLIADFEERWQDPSRREAMLQAARLIESDPDLLGVAGHLLAVAGRDSTPEEPITY
jgi:hypothetical protein